MHLPLRISLIAAALAAIGGFAAALDGCASKQPLPEPPAAATPTPTPTPQPAGKGASAGAELSAAGVSAGVATSATNGASAGDGVSGASGASGGAGISAGGGASPGAAAPSGGRGASPANGASAGDGTSGASGASGGASAGSASGPANPSGRPQTSDERRAALDKRLNDSLGSFDEQLRKEQQRIAQERDARQATVMTVAAVDASPKPDPDQKEGAAGNTATEAPEKGSVSHPGATESRSPRSGDLKSDQGTGGASGNGAASREIPNGNDDDVIARRLRKAAEQETDPELKDKLWKEYVEYKKNTQGQ